MSGLDRVRPRKPQASPTAATTELRDQAGKRALFSLTPETATKVFGSVTVNCGSCGEESTLTPLQAVRAALPSFHLPILRREHPSYLRCPACSKFSWTRLSVQL
ncbi:MAG: hypothetical protein ACJ735_08815 [Actinomycetes bacterium]